MTHTFISHIALVVPDLRAAEGYYQNQFGMELIGREAVLENGLWHTLPFDKKWEDANAAGVELGMLALRKGGFVLALFRGDAPSGQVLVIGLQMPKEEIVAIRSRLPGDLMEAREDGPETLEFRDPYQITWQISEVVDFRTAGDFANRWIRL